MDLSTTEDEEIKEGGQVIFNYSIFSLSNGNVISLMT